MSFFGITVHPNLKSDSDIPTHLSITNAALPSHLIDATTKGRSTLYISVNGGQKLPLCSLTPTVVEQFHLDVIVESGAKVSFSVDGVNPISLVGYLHADEEEQMDTTTNHMMESVSSEPQSEDDQDDDEDDQEMDHHSQDENSGSEDESSEDEEVEQHRYQAKKQPAKSNKTTKSNTVNESVLAKVAEKTTSHQPTPPTSEQAMKKRKLNEANLADTMVSRTLQGGLVVTDLTSPNPSLPKVKSGQRVSMRYIGRLVKNKKVFDSNTKGQPFTFKIGRGEVIKGWDMGILGMHVGQKRKLMIPAKLAYGKQGAMPDIPPNADLEFEVKVVGMK